MTDVRLTPLDEESLARLLDAAVTDADPLEVMSPIEGPPGWTAERRAAFLAFHRRRSLDPATAVETTWVIDVDGRAVGAARLEPAGDAVEAGIWLGRSARGQGVGRQVVTALLDAARTGGATRFVASTTTGNAAARRLLTNAGADLAVHGGDVDATLDL
ncbi:GNAT family N-acetyltransferase [Amycolatopsis sp. NPDC059027]|uniref:GNAT family N-acetyltransferase n=1 Tax=unclassified Amycolatopsis TaxID=2618356 RepID=UPI00366DCE3B